MSEKIKTNTTVSGRGLSKRTTVSITSVDKSGNSFTRTQTTRSFGEKLGSCFGVFCLIVGILLSVCLIRFLVGGTPVTFGGLLEYLSSAPSIDMSMTSFNAISPLQWDGVLSGLASFFNFFITIFNVLIYAFKGVGQVVVYIIYFVKFLFA